MTLATKIQRVLIATQQSRLRMKLRRRLERTLLEDSGELSGKVNYFLGHDPTGWRANVPALLKSNAEGVYPGVDLVYYGNQQELEYDFTIAPAPIRGLSRLSLKAHKGSA